MDYAELWLYPNLPAYKSDYRKIEQQIKKSDVLITDGTHRIVGLMYNEKIADSPIITIQCIRSEVAFAKQIALQIILRLYSTDFYLLYCSRNIQQVHVFVQGNMVL